MATFIGVNVGSGNGLLPDGTKPENNFNVKAPATILHNELENHIF